MKIIRNEIKQQWVCKEELEQSYVDEMLDRNQLCGERFDSYEEWDRHYDKHRPLHMRRYTANGIRKDD